MNQLPHTEDPISRMDGTASYEMRAWMESIERALLIAQATTANLEDIGSDINLYGKSQFKFVGNITSGRIVYASGPDAGDDWLFMDGTTAHTPI